ncbi:GNAT family N-acetyltransferase [Mumia sp. zg.B17]|uniref:GNAT family N-acetyltransferase n=1 Tax=Mumia sp. zg.B17 TaxID=2855446 RepID=UPI002103F0D6|nr:GNAT family N-acetyltransferase [Mumia sp. zg.B17]
MHATSLGDDAVLGPLEPSRAGELLNHMDRGREFVGRYIALPDAVTDLASSRAFLQAYADKATTDTGRIFGIWTAGTLVGGVLFRTMDVEQGTAEAGCWLEPSAVGRGLVTRAVRLIIDWAVEERGIHRVEWQVSPANAASIAVARRLGMTSEGVLRESFLLRGTRHDTEVWSVLAPEWRASTGAGAQGGDPELRGAGGTPSRKGAPHIDRVVPDLSVSDLAAAVRQHTAVLGMDVLMDHGWIVTLGDGTGHQLSLMTTDATATVNPQVSVFVDDVHAAYRAALGAHTEIVHPLTEEPWGVTRFFYRDSSGSVVNVGSHR